MPTGNEQAEPHASDDPTRAALLEIDGILAQLEDDRRELKTANSLRLKLAELSPQVRHVLEPLPQGVREVFRGADLMAVLQSRNRLELYLAHPCPAYLTPARHAVRCALAMPNTGEKEQDAPGLALGGSSQAGKAFLATIQNDPAARAALARAQGRLRAFAAAMKTPEFQRERERARQEQQRAFTELADAIREALRAAGDELAARCFTPPETLEDWEHLGRMVEMPFETIQSGNFTARDVYVMALAWVDRQKMKAKLAGDSEASSKTDTPTGYTVARVLEMAGVSDTTLSKYAKLANVNTPGRGKRNHRYSTDEVRAILHTIIDQSSDRAMKDRCCEALNLL